MHQDTRHTQDGVFAEPAFPQPLPPIPPLEAGLANAPADQGAQRLAACNPYPCLLIRAEVSSVHRCEQGPLTAGRANIPVAAAAKAARAGRPGQGAGGQGRAAAMDPAVRAGSAELGG